MGVVKVESESSGTSNKERILKPRRGFVGIDFPELWRYRELFLFMAWRDVLVRYKQTAVGILWAVLRPLIVVVVFTLFGKMADLSQEGIPQPLLVLTGYLPWQFFASSLSNSSVSLIKNEQMISKIYFPRLILPSAAVLANLVDLLISSVILVAMMAWYGYMPSSSIVWLPAFFMLAFFASLGIGIWFSALSVEYRDIQQIVPFIVQLGIIITNVGYSITKVPEEWRTLYCATNPMVSAINGFRWALLGEKVPLYYEGILLSSGIVLFLFISGVLYFRKMEKTFADII